MRSSRGCLLLFIRRLVIVCTSPAPPSTKPPPPSSSERNHHDLDRRPPPHATALHFLLHFLLPMPSLLVRLAPFQLHHPPPTNQFHAGHFGTTALPANASLSLPHASSSSSTVALASSAISRYSSCLWYSHGATSRPMACASV